MQMKRATAQGTKGYQERYVNSLAKDHFRLAQGLWFSSIGLGTYLGASDDQTDQAYRAAVQRAVNLGCNVIDTAANYRFQRSERSVGEALADLFAGGEVAREELLVATKGGFIPFDTQPPRTREEMTDYLVNTFITPGICRWEDFVQGSHCMTPGYLAHQLEQSLRNLKLDCLDIYYIHNPETQLEDISRKEFFERLHLAFESLEGAVEAGKISAYGTATWNGYRASPEERGFLSLEDVVQTAEEVAGAGHHFKFVQLPVNMGMIEAFTDLNQPLNGRKSNLLEAAVDLEVTIIASGTILQGRLANNLPVSVGESLRGLNTDAQRAIQFTRSTPGVTTALIGMSNVAHVEENMEVARSSPAPLADYMKLFEAR
jgi:aryl-alcohol dehydrogenase-like predicted oxidoreductase